MARNSLKSVIRLIEAAEKQLPPEQEFLQDLKRSIELTANKNSTLPSKTYKPSGMNCIRQSYYQIIGEQPDASEASYVTVGICNSGSDIHERIQASVAGMRDNGLDCLYVDVAEYVKQRELSALEIKRKQGWETKLYHKDLNMSFLCDGIIKYKGRYYILELKTETSRKWWDRQGVDSSHYKQATAYSVALGIDDVIFVYINRDMLDMKSYMFHVTDEMKSDLVGYIDECDRCVEKQTPPAKPQDVSRKTCEYCLYRQSCRRDG